MATTVANLLIKFESDTNNAVRGIDQVNASISSVEKNTMGVGASLSRFGLMAGGVAAAGVVALGGAMAATAVDGFNMASDLEASMSGIAATMQKSRDEIAPLKQLILDLGMNPNLKVSTLEAADAIKSLVANGLTMTEVLNGAAEATVLLSNATGGDFAVSAGIMTDVMKQFKDSAGSYTDAVSQIVAVTSKSKFSIDDYRLAVAQAGGVASSVGVEFGDFNTTLAAVSPLFGSGSDAGTSFKTMLQTLIPKSNDAAAAMQELGLLAADGSNAFFDAQSNLKSMADVSSLLSGALAGLSEEQKNAALSTIFGSDAMRAAVALADSGKVVYTDVALAAKELGVSQDALNAVAKDGITAFEALQVRMGQVDALDAAAERMNNTKGAMEILSGVIETVKIQIGDAFLPVVRQLAETLSAFVSENSGRIVALFGGFAAGIGLVAAYIPALMDGLIGLVEGMGNLWVSIQTTINAWQPFIAAVLAALAPVAEAIGSFVSWKDVLVVLGGIIGGSVVVALGGLVASMAPVVAAVGGLIAASAILRNAWENDWGGIQSTVTSAVASIQSAFAGFQSSASTSAEAAGSVMQMIGDAFGPAIERVKTSFAGMVTIFGTLGPKLDEVMAAFQNLFTALQPLVTFLGGTLAVVALTGVNLISSAFMRLPEVVGEALTTVADLVNGMAEMVSAATALVVAVINGDWAGAWTAAGDLVTAFAETIGTVFVDLNSIVETLIGAVADTVLTTMEQLGINVKGVMGQITSAVQNAFNGLKGFIGGLSFPNPFGSISAAASTIGTKVASVQTALQSFRDWLASFSLPNPFRGWAFPERPWWLGGGGADEPTKALPLDRSLLRATTLTPAPAMVAAGAGSINITINATVANEIDLEALAYRLATIMKRRG